MLQFLVIVVWLFIHWTNCKYEKFIQSNVLVFMCDKNKRMISHNVVNIMLEDKMYFDPLFCIKFE